jgi:hypothetical protein
VRSHPGSTPAELSTAAGVARSTVAKLLTAWATDGSVTSTPAATGLGSSTGPTPAVTPSKAGRDTDGGTGSRRRRGATTTQLTTTHGQPPSGTTRPYGRTADSGSAAVHGAGRNMSGNLGRPPGRCRAWCRTS